MNFHNKTIGIWGFGVVGKAALNYFKTYEIPTTVMDCKNLTPEEQTILDNAKSTFISQKYCNKFLNDHDLILASPGIDLRPFNLYKDKFITELDLFALHNKKKIIAITGTIGKTTITHFLSTIVQNYKKVVTGGNIGTGMLELVPYQDQIAMTLLEVSSFQLEYCQYFAPDLALWTNFYPNHLDRHTTIEDYFNAKYMILAHQNQNQEALVPLELADKIIHKNSHNKNYQGTLHFFSTQQPCLHQLDWLPKNSSIFWLENNTVMHFKNNQTQQLLKLDTVSPQTFATNLLIIIATLYLLEMPLSLDPLNAIQDLEHRIEKIASYDAIQVYNDSKSTIMESTCAAIDKLQGKPILLFLGGLSKGVNRNPYIKKLYGKVRHIFCFGSEAENLQQDAQQYSIESSCYKTLDEAVAYALTYAKPGDQILFSPGGSSYDLYTNYKERGEHFKKLIQREFDVRKLKKMP